MTIEDLVAAQRRWLEGDDGKTLGDYMGPLGRSSNLNLVSGEFVQGHLAMEVALKLSAALDRLVGALDRLEQRVGDAPATRRAGAANSLVSCPNRYCSWYGLANELVDHGRCPGCRTVVVP